MYVSTEVPGNRGYSRRSPNAETGGSWCQRGDARRDRQWSRAASHARCQRRSGATQGGASPDGAEDRGREWVGAGGPPGGAEVPEVAEAWAEAAEADAEVPEVRGAGVPLTTPLRRALDSYGIYFMPHDNGRHSNARFK